MTITNSRSYHLHVSYSRKLSRGRTFWFWQVNFLLLAVAEQLATLHQVCTVHTKHRAWSEPVETTRHTFSKCWTMAGAAFIPESMVHGYLDQVIADGILLVARDIQYIVWIIRNLWGIHCYQPFTIFRVCLLVHPSSLLHMYRYVITMDTVYMCSTRWNQQLHVASSNLLVCCPSQWSRKRKYVKTRGTALA